MQVEDRLKRIEDLSILSKPFAFSELVARIKASTGKFRKTSSVLSIRDLTLNTTTLEVTRAGQKITLAHWDFALLQYLLEHAEQIVSREMIMQHAWNYQFDPQSTVIESRLAKLREKVDKPFNFKLIQTIRGAGYAIKG